MREDEIPSRGERVLGRVRTVLGDIDASSLGRTDVHEHLLMRDPLLPGDELDDVERSTAEAATLPAAGIDALVDVTPLGLGRDPVGLAVIARRTGLTIVCSTGVHHDGHYPHDHPLRSLTLEALVELLVAEVAEGTDPSERGHPRSGAPRAGMIKVGTSYWRISPFERRNLLAAAEAQRRTGAAITCHLELGTAAIEVTELLADAGAALDRLILAHVDRNPDPELHLELARAGAYLGYDGAGRTRHWPDSTLLECLVAVAEGGGADRLLLGGDVARAGSFRSYGGLPGLDYLPRRFVRRLEARGGPMLTHRILVENPARVLAMRPGSSDRRSP